MYSVVIHIRFSIQEIWFQLCNLVRTFLWLVLTEISDLIVANLNTITSPLYEYVFNYNYLDLKTYIAPFIDVGYSKVQYSSYLRSLKWYTCIYDTLDKRYLHVKETKLKF